MVVIAPIPIHISFTSHSCTNTHTHIYIYRCVCVCDNNDNVHECIVLINFIKQRDLLFVRAMWLVIASRKVAGVRDDTSVCVCVCVCVCAIIVNRWL